MRRVCIFFCLVWVQGVLFGVSFAVGFRVYCSEFLRTGKYHEGASERGGSRKFFLNTPICLLTRPLFATIFEADRGVKENFSKGGGSGGTLTIFSGSHKLRLGKPKPQEFLLNPKPLRKTRLRNKLTHKNKFLLKKK